VLWEVSYHNSYLITVWVDYIGQTAFYAIVPLKCNVELVCTQCNKKSKQFGTHQVLIPFLAGWTLANEANALIFNQLQTMHTSKYDVTFQLYCTLVTYYDTTQMQWHNHSIAMMIANHIVPAWQEIVAKTVQCGYHHTSYLFPNGQIWTTTDASYTDCYTHTECIHCHLHCPPATHLIPIHQRKNIEVWW